MGTTRRQTVRAYAKINLGLRILRKRPDGYHDIETVFHRVALHDTISMVAGDRLELVCEADAVPADERNLALRAALLLRESTGTRQGVSVTLTKRIPVGAGLGGGSSDAASVLTHLPRLWGIDVSPEALRRLALELGSDVPYFLERGSALARGRGDLLDYFPLPLPFTILVCYPRVHVSTAWAYQQVRPRTDVPARDLADIIRDGIEEPAILRGELVNDFEESVVEAYPVIGDIKRILVVGGAVYASMSGSGSAVFGFFRDEGSARETAASLDARGFFTSLTPPFFDAGPNG